MGCSYVPQDCVVIVNKASACLHLYAPPIAGLGHAEIAIPVLVATDRVIGEGCHGDRGIAQAGASERPVAEDCNASALNELNNGSWLDGQ